jgi:Domain of unknown function (DUF4136)
MKWMALALLGATSCTTAAVPNSAVATSVSSPHVPLAAYHTFSFGLADQPKSGYEVTPRSLEVQRRLRPLVLAALQERGYTENETKADFIVKLATGTGAGPGPGPEVERAVHVPVARGFIGINIYDAPTGTEVWQGSAFAEIDPEKIDDSLLEMGVSHMLAGFPARESAGVASMH